MSKIENKNFVISSWIFFILKQQQQQQQQSADEDSANSDNAGSDQEDNDGTMDGMNGSMEHNRPSFPSSFLGLSGIPGLLPGPSGMHGDNFGKHIFTNYSIIFCLFVIFSIF